MVAVTATATCDIWCFIEHQWCLSRNSAYPKAKALADAECDTCGSFMLIHPILGQTQLASNCCFGHTHVTLHCGMVYMSQNSWFRRSWGHEAQIMRKPCRLLWSTWKHAGCDFAWNLVIASAWREANCMPQLVLKFAMNIFHCSRCAFNRDGHMRDIFFNLGLKNLGWSIAGGRLTPKFVILCSGAAPLNNPSSRRYSVGFIPYIAINISNG